MYFDRLKLWDAIPGGAVLHVAPENYLRDAIARLAPQEYVRGDLFPASDDLQKINVTAIAYPDEHFDLVICNHVLEHVPDDRRAMMELHRVLKKGRHAVLQTPFSAFLSSSFQDPNINTDELRKKFYGQEDHVRLYGQDLFTRLDGAGFEVMPQKHQVVLEDLDGKFYGVNTKEDLILVKKSG
jgi:ubiquinone/menaquinone biosynthesis C-methylase UbiE